MKRRFFLNCCRYLLMGFLSHYFRDIIFGYYRCCSMFLNFITLGTKFLLGFILLINFFECFWDLFSFILFFLRFIFNFFSFLRFFHFNLGCKRLFLFFFRLFNLFINWLSLFFRYASRSRS